MDEARAWENYWRQHGSRGCVPGSPGVASTLTAVWRDLAEQLPAGARVLDLGSGAGAVLESLVQARSDLDLVGIDSIQALERAPLHVSILTGVCMEELPFDDDSFDGISSQFGIEYGDTTRAIPEVARVARTDAFFRFVIHDSEGPIVAQGKSRSEGLAWAADESGSFAVAERLISNGEAPPLTPPPELARAVEAARTKFPREPVASEVMLALLQIVGDSHRLTAAERAQRIRHLRDQVECEIATLRALLRSARDERGVAEITQSLARNGAAVENPRKLVDPRSGWGFAWLISGRFS